MFQAILEALKGLGGGVAKGIGSSYGLPFELTKTAGKMTGAGANLPMDIYSPYYSPGKKPSVWQEIGFALGGKAGSAQAPSTPSSDINIPLASQPQIQQSRGYQGRGKKSQIETLLSQLARR